MHQANLDVQFYARTARTSLVLSEDLFGRMPSEQADLDAGYCLDAPYRIPTGSVIRWKNPDLKPSGNFRFRNVQDA